MIGEARLAAFRGRLLRARTCPQVLGDVVELAVELGLAPAAFVVVRAKDHASLPQERGARGGFMRIDLGTAQREARAWMESAAVAEGWAATVWDERSTQAWQVVIGAPRESDVPEVGDVLLVLEAALGDVREALELAGTFERFGGAEASRLREDVARRDALLRQAGNAMMRDADEIVRVVSALEQREAAINADLHQALTFQRAMLTRMPVHDEVALDAAYLPAELISGDFYDVSVLGPDRIRVFVADATGHGIAAGLATMFIKSEYEAIKRSPCGPGALLSTMNESLASRYRRLELRFTALCVDVYPSRRCIRYAPAAHPGPILARPGGPEILQSGGTFVGVATGITFAEHDAAFAAGDVMLAHTDGLLDAEAKNGETFGEQRTLDVLARAAATGSVCPPLVRAVADFVGVGRGLTDDIAVVSVAFPRRG